MRNELEKKIKNTKNKFYKKFYHPILAKMYGKLKPNNAILNTNVNALKFLYTATKITTDKILRTLQSKQFV